MEKTIKERIKKFKQNNPFKTQTDIAYELIRSDILEFRLKPNEKINQDAISIDFDMSRTPIRDAILKLEQDGLVVQAAKGYQVFEMSVKDYMDFHEFRIRLETYATMLATRLMTDNQILELKDSLREFNKYCEQGNLEMAAIYDEKFHELIIKGSRNEYVIKTHELFSSKQKYYLQRLIKMGLFDVSYAVAKKKHLEIYRAICERDEKRAEEAMRSHLAFYRHRMYDLL
ncbi:MAG: hypothetical protein BEN18_07935 [Epulopiscium sp. Nuni2H_MBin001]|nr:MAG: hypothetical protein BEN18_07935 [Epulopiscium sp. Nuni2H_MBin001]